MPRINAFQKLLSFLDELAKRRVPYDLEHSRYDAVMVKIFDPDEYWEVEFFPDGEVEVQIFKDSPMTVIGNPRAERLTRELLKSHDQDEVEMQRSIRDARGRLLPRVPRKQTRRRAPPKGGA